MGKMKKKNKSGGGPKFKGHGKKRNLKMKGKGKDNSEAVAVVSGSEMKINNPFEIRMHRAKHDNLGRRARWEKGTPGVSRSKAIEKRKETLLKEYKVRSKTNVIVDRRIGEKVKNMPEEEKIARRSVLEKKRQYKQKSIFNLPSTDDILTHKGQILTDIDRYEDPRDESDSEDERLNEEFVSDAHFSGDFLTFKKPSVLEDDDPSADTPASKSRKDIISELILQSKQRKFEKAKEADETYELVSKLDQEFKTPDFRNLLNFVRKGDSSSEPPPPPPSVPPPPTKPDYDKLVRQLQFEQKTGNAANRLLTPEELQQEELEKLNKLEKDRLRRMKAQDPTVPQHRSADDLGDDFEQEDVVPPLSYKKDGQLIQRSSDEEGESESEEEETGSIVEHDDEDDEPSESDSDSDGISDLESGAESGDEDASFKATKVRVEMEESEKMDAAAPIEDNDDIPFTFSLPKGYEGFRKLLRKYRANISTFGTGVERQLRRFETVLERLVKYCMLAEKERLPELFLYVLKMVMESAESTGTLSQELNMVIGVTTAHLHSLLVASAEKCCGLMETEFEGYFRCGSGNKVSLAKIVLFSICARLFCVTDFCHRILSPMKLNILELVNGSCHSYMGTLKMLTLVDILYDCSNESSRFCPEAAKFLIDILEGVAYPLEKLRMKRRRFDFLRVDDLLENSNLSEAALVEPTVLTEDDVETPTKSQVLSLLLRVFQQLNGLLESQHRTKPFNHLLHKVRQIQLALLKLKWEDRTFHKELFSRKLKSELFVPRKLEKSLEDVAPGNLDRPKMLRLYDPLIEDNFDGNKRNKMKRKGMTQEASRLAHKVKKEMKSAYREMVKDNAFLAKQQLKEQAAKDAERNRRVKEILGGLANQEGDYRKIIKPKKS